MLIITRMESYNWIRHYPYRVYPTAYLRNKPLFCYSWLWLSGSVPSGIYCPLMISVLVGVGHQCPVVSPAWLSCFFILPFVLVVLYWPSHYFFFLEFHHQSFAWYQTKPQFNQAGNKRLVIFSDDDLILEWLVSWGSTKACIGLKSWNKEMPGAKWSETPKCSFTLSECSLWYVQTSLVSGSKAGDPLQCIYTFCLQALHYSSSPTPPTLVLYSTSLSSKAKCALFFLLVHRTRECK